MTLWCCRKRAKKAAEGLKQEAAAAAQAPDPGPSSPTPPLEDAPAQGDAAEDSASPEEALQPQQMNGEGGGPGAGGLRCWGSAKPLPP